MFNRTKGFTLLEIVTVIGIIGILSSIAVISGGVARQKARDSRRVADLETIRNGLVLYSNFTGKYPSFGQTGYLFSTDQDWLTTLVNAHIISNPPLDPKNVRISQNSFERVLAAPPLIPPTATPTPTATPPLPTPPPTLVTTPTGSAPGTPTPTATPTHGPGTPTPTPTNGPAYAGQEPTSFLYGIYAASAQDLSSIFSANQITLLLCAKMEHDKQNTIGRGKPNQTLANALLGVNFSPDSYCLVL